MARPRPTRPTPRAGLGPRTVAALLIIGAVTIAGCGSSTPGAPTTAPNRSAAIPARLLREARPIGRGPRFHPAARGAVPGPCRHGLGARNASHVEVFAADRVVVIAAGIGVRGPVARNAGRIVAAHCFGSVVTLEPTGVVLSRPAARPVTLATLFAAWGQVLSRTRVAGFKTSSTQPVRVYVGGRRVGGPPGAVPLRRHGEIVVEIGPDVPPHRDYTFPPGL